MLVRSTSRCPPAITTMLPVMGRTNSWGYLHTQAVSWHLGAGNRQQPAEYEPTGRSAEGGSTYDVRSQSKRARDCSPQVDGPGVGQNGQVDPPSQASSARIKDLEGWLIQRGGTALQSSARATPKEATTALRQGPRGLTASGPMRAQATPDLSGSAATMARHWDWTHIASAFTVGASSHKDAAIL